MGRGAVGDLPDILAPIKTQGASFVLADSLTSTAEHDDLLWRLRDQWGGVDFLIHCTMPPDTGATGHPYMDTDIVAFQAAMACCVHGFAALARRAARIMAPGGRLLSLNWPVTGTTDPGNGLSEVIRATQAAAVRVLAEDLGPMGIRVNAIVGGAIRSGPSAHRP